jgi:hypothetical protein
VGVGIFALTGAFGKKVDQEKLDADAAAAIKVLIPQAASMTVDEWARVGAPGEVPHVDNMKNQPLSLILLSVNSDEMKGEAAGKEFRGLTDTLFPDVLAATIMRSKDKGYGTMIQAEFITDITCRVKGNEAMGAVSFRADKLYEGRAEYTARKTRGGDWRVEEFRMPAYKFRVTLQPDGKWKHFAIP